MVLLRPLTGHVLKVVVLPNCATAHVQQMAVADCATRASGGRAHLLSALSSWQMLLAGSPLSLPPSRDVFAVLEEPAPVLPAVGKGRKKKGKDSEKWAAAEAAAVAASMAAATVVRIKALDGLGCSTICHQVCTRGDMGWQECGVQAHRQSLGSVLLVKGVPVPSATHPLQLWQVDTYALQWCCWYQSTDQFGLAC